MPRHSHKESAVLPAVLLISGILIIGGLIWYFVTTDDPPRLDPRTQCPVERSVISGYVAVIIDRTEEVNEVQAAAIRTAIGREISATKPYESVAMYELVGRSSLVLKDFARACNPSRPPSGSAIREKLDRDEAFERKRFEDKFRGELLKLLETKLDVPPQQDSPIMEMIQAVSVKELGSAPEKATRRLVLVSDMMQHSPPDATHYRGWPPKDFFSGSFFRRVRTDLTGVEVRIYYIERAGGPSEQPKEHKAFWNEYFDRLGASQLVVVPIQGAGWVRRKTGGQN